HLSDRCRTPTNSGPRPVYNFWIELKTTMADRIARRAFIGKVATLAGALASHNLRVVVCVYQLLSTESCFAELWQHRSHSCRRTAYPLSTPPLTLIFEKTENWPATRRTDRRPEECRSLTSDLCV